MKGLIKMKVMKKLTDKVQLELGIARGEIQSSNMNDITGILNAAWDGTSKRNDHNWYTECSGSVMTGSTLMMLKCECAPQTAIDVIKYIFKNNLPVMFQVTSILKSSFVDD